MRVVIDTGLCSGHGRCYTLAPEVFDSDEGGYGVVRSAELPPDLEDKARIGVDNCPERAITIEP
jgi:ferredoxin